MRYQNAAEAVRGARLAADLSQRELALRAGTSQAAISRIERGREQPTIDRLSSLLFVMGLRPVLTLAPTASPEPERGLTPAERLREAASWNLMATKLELEGERARAAGDPATR